MKSVILAIAISIIYSQHIMAQNDCRSDSIMYMTAYNYIVNDSINKMKSIEVSDSITDLDWYFFSSLLTQYPKEQEFVKTYRSKKGFQWFHTYYSSCLSSWFYSMNRLTEKVVFFSQPENNMLRVDLLPYDNKRVGFNNRFNYESYIFVVAYVYLFVFDENKMLRIVFREEIVYE